MSKPKFPSVVDATMMNDWRTCQTLFMYAHRDDWKPQKHSIHLHAGAAFAHGLEAARRAFYEQGKDQETAVAVGVGALLEAYGDFECPEGIAKTPERMAGALEYYFNVAWPLAEGAVPAIMPSGKRAIEFSFAQPLPFLNPDTQEPVIYAGRSDMIAAFSGGIYIEDDKTTSQLGASWPKQWEMRAQFTGYCWAAREAGIKVTGSLIRGVSILKTKYDHAQAITNRPDWEIDRWLAQTLRDLEAMKLAYASGVWNFSLGEGCQSYGGCDFTQICKSNTPRDWLPMYFERRHWDPLERTETPLEGMPWE